MGIATFTTDDKLRLAIANFVERGFKLVRDRDRTLWPGEVRSTEVEGKPAVEWKAVDQYPDPDLLLWERLRELHEAGDGRRIGRAVFQLLSGTSPADCYHKTYDDL